MFPPSRDDIIKYLRMKIAERRIQFLDFEEFEDQAYRAERLISTSSPLGPKRLLGCTTICNTLPYAIP